MNRQEFLRSVAAGGLAATVTTTGSLDVMAQGGSAKSKAGVSHDLVAVMGGEPVPMFEAGIARMGGIGRFVKKGQRVTLKPNIGWDRPPELAANTNPDLVAAVVRACLDAGAADVTVFDHTCDEWRACYRSSGIPAAAEAAGAKVVPGNDRTYYREVEIPGAKSLKKAMVHQAILDCDVWINMPVLKHHGGANMTIAMKNLMGIVFDRRFFHGNDLNQCIADICLLKPQAALHIVDAYRIVTTNGPKGRSPSDVATPKGLLLSTDPVAVDTAATRFFSQVKEMPLDRVVYLARGEELGLGTMDLDKLSVDRIRI
ncbi:MAG: DUF362 domain-containing protein [Planctomycetia bacterium]|nr:DUF362 domain-containing protein [Planctomycetia bacterium]